MTINVGVVEDKVLTDKDYTSQTFYHIRQEKNPTRLSSSLEKDLE